MRGVNQVVLGGNVGRDPELRSTTNGQSVTNFSLAVNRAWRDKDGNLSEATEWFNITVWGKQAEVVAKSRFQLRNGGKT